MAAQGEGGGKDEIKTQFITREGTYKLMTLSEYSRPNRVAYNGQANTPVKVSFIYLNDPSSGQSGDRICFNVGRELYFYAYKGAADLTKPIDKRVYKGTFPTCHDFNRLTASVDSVMLLVGFTAGQVQLIDPIKKELSKLYNEERLIDKTKVTCIKWIPGSPNQFLVSHSSGQMYVYNEELPCGATPPHYQSFKSGEGFSVHTCKTKSTRNPLYRWVVGEGAINEFAFSPCSKYLAVVSQDGYLRIYNYNTMEVMGVMKSYFGGLLCVCWSPDGKYIVTGGEDDLVTVWSLAEKRVICRGQGHKSWVNAVTFDPFTTSVNDCDGNDFSGSDEEFNNPSRNSRDSIRDSVKSGNSSGKPANSNRNSLDAKSLTATTCLYSYRFGSIGQDTVMCLWDLTEDILRQPFGSARSRTSVILPSNAMSLPARCNSLPHSHLNSIPKEPSLPDGNAHHNTSNATSLTQKFATLAIGDRKDREEKKEHKRNFSLASKSSDKTPLLKANHVKPVDESMKILGTHACPRLDEVPLLEPLVCKKIAHERLTALVFREECLVTACQEGFVCTWARPGKVGLTQQHSSVTPQSSTGGTVV
ncbi:WD repeat-containing protein 20-like isoform X2 [Lineus longissimus]|uniref:WD repeat-containing protein 20-like isoform X2 n=1 Tax=Lineus longissimus TaxID=88925 RepID=UPI00315DBACF